MKKWMLLILAVIFMFGLSSCDPDDPDTGKTADTYINPALVE